MKSHDGFVSERFFIRKNGLLQNKSRKYHVTVPLLSVQHGCKALYILFLRHVKKKYANIGLRQKNLQIKHPVVGSIDHLTRFYLFFYTALLCLSQSAYPQVKQRVNESFGIPEKVILKR
jgi:hypothetical protein